MKSCCCQQLTELPDRIITNELCLSQLRKGKCHIEGYRLRCGLQILYGYFIWSETGSLRGGIFHALQQHLSILSCHWNNSAFVRNYCLVVNGLLGAQEILHSVPGRSGSTLLIPQSISNETITMCFKELLYQTQHYCYIRAAMNPRGFLDAVHVADYTF